MELIADSSRCKIAFNLLWCAELVTRLRRGGDRTLEQVAERRCASPGSYKEGVHRSFDTWTQEASAPARARDTTANHYAIRRGTRADYCSRFQSKHGAEEADISPNRAAEWRRGF